MQLGTLCGKNTPDQDNFKDADFLELPISSLITKRHEQPFDTRVDHHSARIVMLPVYLPPSIQACQTHFAYQAIAGCCAGVSMTVSI